MARCLPIILSSYSGAAVVPCFATHNTNTQFDHHDPPAEKFNVFKRLLCIDEDPQWHELGLYIVCVPLCRIVHVAYMHIQRNVTIQNVFELCTISNWFSYACSTRLPIESQLGSHDYFSPDVWIRATDLVARKSNHGSLICGTKWVRNSSVGRGDPLSIGTESVDYVFDLHTCDNSVLRSPQPPSSQRTPRWCSDEWNFSICDANSHGGPRLGFVTIHVAPQAGKKN